MEYNLQYVTNKNPELTCDVVNLHSARLNFFAPLLLPLAHTFLWKRCIGIKTPQS